MVSHGRLKLVNELRKECCASATAPVDLSQQVCLDLGISLVLGNITGHLDGNDAGALRPDHATQVSEAELLFNTVVLYLIGLHDTAEGALAQFIHHSVLVAKDVTSCALIELRFVDDRR